jgi:hypothetical protein
MPNADHQIQGDVSGVLAACSRLDVHDRAERFRTNGGGALGPGRSAAPLGAARLVHFLTQSKHGRGGSHDEQAWPARPEDRSRRRRRVRSCHDDGPLRTRRSDPIAHASSRVESMRLKDKLADAQFTRGCGRPTNSWPHSSQESFRYASRRPNCGRSGRLATRSRQDKLGRLSDARRPGRGQECNGSLAAG